MPPDAACKTPKPMTRDEILNTLDAAGLGHRREEAAALLQPVLRLTTEPSQGDLFPVGASKMGGEPDLPPSTPWPHWYDEQNLTDTMRRLNFLVQVNFADVEGLIPNSPLPPSGLLSVFYDADEQPWGHDKNDNAGFKVIYTPADVLLERREISEAP